MTRECKHAAAELVSEAARILHHYHRPSAPPAGDSTAAAAEILTACGMLADAGAFLAIDKMNTADVAVEMLDSEDRTVDQLLNQIEALQKVRAAGLVLCNRLGKSSGRIQEAREQFRQALKVAHEAAK